MSKVILHLNSFKSYLGFAQRKKDKV